MRRVLFTISAATALVLPARSAAAQERLGEKGQLIISVDRLVPLFSYTSTKLNNPNGSSTTDSLSRFSLLSSGFGGSGFDTFNIHNVPRVSFDYTVTHGLTLGGSIIVFFSGGGTHTATDRNGVSRSVDANGYTLFGVAPRVGYILRLGRSNFYFWPRGGVSFYSLNVKTHNPNGSTNSDTYSDWAIDIEAMFAFSPVAHVAFTLGPTADVPFTGSHSSTPAGEPTTSTDFSQLQIGGHLGLLAYF
jgi:hypothetical protein